mgnify:CR=1 FL=1
MISDKQKVEIFERISCYSKLENILNILFEEIDNIGKFAGKIFYLIENEDFIIIKIDFSNDLNINENVYLNIKAKIKKKYLNIKILKNKKTG